MKLTRLFTGLAAALATAMFIGLAAPVAIAQDNPAAAPAAPAAAPCGARRGHRPGCRRSSGSSRRAAELLRLGRSKSAPAIPATRPGF